MRKYILAALLGSILVSSIGYSIAPLQLRTAVQTIVFGFLEVPYNQATGSAGYTARINTGNENRLINGNFESSINLEAWDEATVGAWTSGNTNGLSGKCLALDTTVALGAGELRQSLSFNTHEQGVNIVASIYIHKGDLDEGNYEVCLDSICKDINIPGYHPYRFMGQSLATNTFYVRPKDGTFTGGTRVQLSVDIASLGIDSTGRVEISNDTNWKSYTPIFTGFGTVTNVKFRYRQDGPDMVIQGEFQTGVVSATTGTFTMPNSLVAEMPYNGLVGDAARNVSTTNNDYTLLSIDGDNTIGFGARNLNTLSPLIRQNASFLIGNSQFMGVTARIPIQGWSASSDAVVEKRSNTLVFAKGHNGETVNSGDPIVFNEVSDTNNVWDGTTFTPIESGRYLIDASVFYTNAPDRYFYFKVNRQGQGYTFEQLIEYNSNGQDVIPMDGKSIDLQVGDTLQIADSLNGGTLSTGSIMNQVHYLYITQLETDKVIAATLQGINSTDLLDFEAKGNAGQSITASVTPIPFLEVTDPSNSWDGDEFTTTRKGTFTFDGAEVATAGSNRTIDIWVDRGSGYTKEDRCNNSVSSSLQKFTCTVKLNATNKVHFRSDVTHTLSNQTLHKLSITESASHEAIANNLSLTKDKCQTKTLAAHASSLGAIPNLTFNNVDASKYYSFHANLNSHHTEGSSNDKIITTIVNGLDLPVGARELSGRASNVLTFRTPLSHAIPFAKASSTIVEVEIIAATRMQIISGSSATLCELGNTIQTTEFN
jgi:hypothetical protein